MSKKQQSHFSDNQPSKSFEFLIQSMVLAGVLALLVFLGFLLFRKPILERYFFKKTGYQSQISSFDLDLSGAMIELRDVVIFNKDPYPNEPLGKISKIRIEWDLQKTRRFPKELRLLEIEIDSLSVIRLDGNEFNVLGFVESLVAAWGKGSPGYPLHIQKSLISWTYIKAIDDERKDGKRLEVLLEYEAMHENVTSIRQITNPPMLLAKEKIDGFYFFNYVTDQIKSLLK